MFFLKIFVVLMCVRNVISVPYIFRSICNSKHVHTDFVRYCKGDTSVIKTYERVIRESTYTTKFLNHESIVNSEHKIIDVTYCKPVEIDRTNIVNRLKLDPNHPEVIIIPVNKTCPLFVSGDTNSTYYKIKINHQLSLCIPGSVDKDIHYAKIPTAYYDLAPFCVPFNDKYLLVYFNITSFQSAQKLDLIEPDVEINSKDQSVLVTFKPQFYYFHQEVRFSTLYDHSVRYSFSSDGYYGFYGVVNIIPTSCSHTTEFCIANSKYPVPNCYNVCIEGHISDLPVKFRRFYGVNTRYHSGWYEQLLKFNPKDIPVEDNSKQIKNNETILSSDTLVSYLKNISFDRLIRNISNNKESSSSELLEMINILKNISDSLYKKPTVIRVNPSKIDFGTLKFFDYDKLTATFSNIFSKVLTVPLKVIPSNVSFIDYHQLEVLMNNTISSFYKAVTGQLQMEHYNFSEIGQIRLDKSDFVRPTRVKRSMASWIAGAISTLMKPFMTIFYDTVKVLFELIVDVLLDVVPLFEKFFKLLLDKFEVFLKIVEDFVLFLFRLFHSLIKSLDKKYLLVEYLTVYIILFYYFRSIQICIFVLYFLFLFFGIEKHSFSIIEIVDLLISGNIEQLYSFNITDFNSTHYLCNSKFLKYYLPKNNENNTLFNYVYSLFNSTIDFVIKTAETQNRQYLQKLEL